MMTAAEMLSAAEPPADDSAIDKALADLDVKIWTWTDAMMSAQAALRNTYAQRPAAPPGAGFFDTGAQVMPVVVPAYVQPGAPLSPPQMAPPPSDSGLDWRPTILGAGPAQGGGPATNTMGGWPQPGAAQPMGGPAQGHGSANQWPSDGGQWGTPTTTTAPDNAPAWPTWSSIDNPTAQPAAPAPPAAGPGKKGGKGGKGPKVAPPIVEGPSHEELAARAAAEEAQLTTLDETTARRVRLLRRLDPDTPIEKLIDKARAAQVDTGPKDEKSSWWRRK